MRDYLSRHHGAFFDNTFGPKTGKAMMHSCAGRWVRKYNVQDEADNGQFDRYW